MAVAAPVLHRQVLEGRGDVDELVVQRRVVCQLGRVQAPPRLAPQQPLVLLRMHRATGARIHYWRHQGEEASSPVCLLGCTVRLSSLAVCTFSQGPWEAAAQPHLQHAGRDRLRLPQLLCLAERPAAECLL